MSAISVPERWRAGGIGALFGLWIAVTAALVEPLQAALLNGDQLSVAPATLARSLGSLALAIGLPLAMVGAAVSAFSPLRGVALLAALCTAAWIQADLFLIEYGTFDGRPLDWSAHGGLAWLEALVWLGLPALALARPTLPARYAPRILAALVLMQTAGLGGSLANSGPLAVREPPRSNPDASPLAVNLARFSSRSNGILIVLDALQSDYFAEAMQSESLAASMPEGFVYYRNAISLYTSTQFSLQSMLTASAVPGGKGALGWRSRQMRKSLPVALSNAGFDAHLVSFAPPNLSCSNLAGSVPCTLLSSVGKLSAADAHALGVNRELVQLGLFRLAPHILKLQIYDAGEWKIAGPFGAQSAPPAASLPRATRDDLMALGQLTKELSVEDIAPRFRFLHFAGAHAPALARADCNGRATGDPRERAVKTTRCVLSRVFALLHALDAQGGYDPSFILIVADHGFPKGRIEARHAIPALPESNGKRARLPYSSMGVPVFLAKRPGERGELRVTDHPVSLCDIPASFLDALDVSAPTKPSKRFGCDSIFAAERKTPRLHFRYADYEQQKRQGPPNQFHFDFTPYRVDGHSWHANSWQPMFGARPSN